MGESAEEAKTESDVIPPHSEEGKLGFDNDTLRGKKAKRLPCSQKVKRFFKPFLTRGNFFLRYKNAKLFISS